MKNAERYVTEGLRQLAEEMPPAHVDFETVRRQAGHSPARAVVLAVAAAAAAIALPIGAVHFFNQPKGTPQPSATTSTPSRLPSLSTDLPTPTASTPAPQRTVAFSLLHLGIGPAPALPYYSDGKIYAVGGSTGITLPIGSEEALLSFARFGDGWVALVLTSAQNEETRIYDAAGSQIDAFFASTEGFARGQDGSTALSREPGQVTLVDRTASELQTWLIPDARGVTPVAVLPDHSVVVNVSSAGGGRQVTVRAMPDGSLLPMSPGWASGVSQSSQDVALMWSTCSAVYGTDPLRPRWTACPYQGGVFSPDGRYVAALANSTPGEAVGIIDANTGDVKVRFEPQPHIGFGLFRSLIWEDDTHALVMAWSNKQQAWYPLRLGVDGSVETSRTPALRTGFFPDRPVFEIPE